MSRLDAERKARSVEIDADINRLDKIFTDLMTGLEAVSQDTSTEEDVDALITLNKRAGAEIARIRRNFERMRIK